MSTEPEPIDANEAGELALQRYLDGRLDESAQASMKDQLTKDPEARRRLDALREEDQLLVQGLETLSEPPVPISDKVMQILRAEYRQRLALARARKLRNQIFGAVGLAAMLMLTFYFMRPKESAGAILSGTSASVQREDKTLPLGLKEDFYEGDTLVTQRGQYVRVVLAGGAQFDLYEDTRLKIEKTGRAPLVVLESGRAGLVLSSSNAGIAVRTPGGTVRFDGGTNADLWVPHPYAVRGTDWLDAWSPERRLLPAPAYDKTCITLLEGAASVTEAGKHWPIAARTRAFLEVGAEPKAAAFVALSALDDRREDWAGKTRGPVGRVELGLLPPFTRSWVRQGESMHLEENFAAAKELRAALAVLDTAEAAKDPKDRAARLAQGQLALRRAAESYDTKSDRRLIVRTLEGLAHFERGRVLLAGTAGSRDEVLNAFRAASAAFHEALEGNPESGPSGLAERTMPELTGSYTGLAPADQALLLSKFYGPLALSYLAQLGSTEASEQPDAALAALVALNKTLGTTVEASAINFVEARIQKLDGKLKESADLLEEICLGGNAANSDEARVVLDGLRQAAHLELARTEAELGEPHRIKDVLEQFQARYPWQEARVGETLALLSEPILRIANQSVAERPEKARDCFDFAFRTWPTLPPAQRFGQVEALLNCKDARALEVFRVLEKQPGLSPLERERLEALRERVNALSKPEPAIP